MCIDSEGVVLVRATPLSLVCMAVVVQIVQTVSAGGVRDVLSVGCAARDRAPIRCAAVSSLP